MWTQWQQLDAPLAGLVSAVGEVLSALSLTVGDERVRDIPSARVIRYYQSTGLIDRPLRYDGRRAMYGFRHLVQVVAIKLLQSESISLARIQGMLAGRTTEELARLISASTSGSPASSASLAPEPRLTSTAVVRCELAPGVVVYLDPALVSDPDALLAALRAALPPRGEP